MILVINVHSYQGNRPFQITLPLYGTTTNSLRQTQILLLFSYLSFANGKSSAPKSMNASDLRRITFKETRRCCLSFLANRSKMLESLLLSGKKRFPERVSLTLTSFNRLKCFKYMTIYVS